MPMDWVSVLIWEVVPRVMAASSLFAMVVWLERKGLARIQNRIGPNRAGPFGWFQPVADGIKLLTKEDLVPTGADRWMHGIAPVMMVVVALLTTLVIPISSCYRGLPLENTLLVYFAIGAFSPLALFLAGWASHNKFSLLGGLRSMAQLISYEIPLALAVVPVVMLSSSLNPAVIVERQAQGGWFLLTPWGIAAFLIFAVAGLAEANRAPFDLPEAESELVAGPLTEYSGFKYALFFLAEYVNAFVIASLAVTCFLGGWNGPFGGVAMEPVWFGLKWIILIAGMIWVRGTLPRLRIDQVLGLAWKFLIPLALVNLMVAGFCYYLPVWKGWVLGGILLVAVYRILYGMFFRSTYQPRIYRFES